MALLDLLYNTNNQNMTSVMKSFYASYPFYNRKELQYPGNVIQYLLIQISKIQTSEDSEGYTREEWKKYKQTCFNKIHHWLKQPQFITSFTARDLACSLHRIALIVEKEKYNTEETVLHLLINNLHQKQKEASTQEIATSLWAAAKLSENKQFTLDEKTKESLIHLLKELSKKQDLCDSQHIAISLWAMGKLSEQQQFTLGETTVLDLINALSKQQDLCDSQAIANSLWALGKLSEKQQQFILDETATKSVLNLLNALSKKHDLNTQAIANSLWALGKLSEKQQLILDETATKSVLDLINALSKKRHLCKPQHIANSLWALSKLSEKQQLILDETTKKSVLDLINALSKKQQLCDLQQITSSLWAMGKLSVTQQLILDETTKKSVLDLVNLLKQQNSLTPQHISNSLWALGKLRETCQFRLDKVTLEFAYKLLHMIFKKPEATTQNLANSLWAIGVLFAKEKALLASVKKEIIPLFNKILKNKEPEILEEGKMQLLMAIGLLNIKDSIDPQIFDNQFGELIKNQKEKALENEKVSVLLKEYEVFKHETEAWICGFFVDLLIHTKDGKKIIVEVDGPIHSTLKKSQFDQFRDEILRDRGYTIRRIDRDELRKMMPSSGVKDNPHAFFQSALVPPNASTHQLNPSAPASNPGTAYKNSGHAYSSLDPS